MGMAPGALIRAACTAQFWETSGELKLAVLYAQIVREFSKIVISFAFKQQALCSVSSLSRNICFLRSSEVLAEHLYVRASVAKGICL